MRRSNDTILALALALAACDGGSPTDAGAMLDAAALDAGLDAATLDAAVALDADLDAAVLDAGLDAATLDAAMLDAGLDGCEPPTSFAPPLETDLDALDLSETGVVRGVWLSPSDRPFAPGLRERLDRFLDLAEDFLRDELHAEGVRDAMGRGRTLRRARAADGRWDVVFLAGRHPSAHYHAHPDAPDAAGQALHEIFQRLPAAFHRDATVIYLYDTAIASGDALAHTGQGGSAAPWQGDHAGYALIGAHALGHGFWTVTLDPSAQACAFADTTASGLSDFDHDNAHGPLSRGGWASTFLGAAIHEIGHAYGLEHDFVDHDGDGVEANLMGNGFRRLGARFGARVPPPPTRLGPTSAAGLAAHPWIR
ncbi:MAG: hypothetical protein KF729_20760 [Sandaracinaceae bacterium]|nr:hypothetical protein [Sandaracinaceae bacterium]